MRKVAERKIINMHLLKACKVICKSDVKIDGKRNRKREKARKVAERKMSNKHLLEYIKVHI
jgi:hypothetical protein